MRDEALCRQRFELYQRLFEQAPDATIVADSDGRILFLNRAARDLPKDLAARLFEDAGPEPSELDPFRWKMRRNGRASVEVQLDGRAHLLDGRTFGADRIVVVRDVSAERARGADVRTVHRLASIGTSYGASRRSSGVENVDDVEPASMVRRRSHGEVATVLLVDGDDVVRQALRLVLEDSGYRVLDAEHGERALDVARRFDGPIHLLVTEVVLPRMMGRELARRLASTRAVKVLFTSGETDRTLQRCGFAPGAPSFSARRSRLPRFDARCATCSIPPRLHGCVVRTNLRSKSRDQASPRASARQNKPRSAAEVPLQNRCGR